jgi:hypothetical protein
MGGSGGGAANDRAERFWEHGVKGWYVGVLDMTRLKLLSYDPPMLAWETVYLLDDGGEMVRMPDAHRRRKDPLADGPWH